MANWTIPHGWLAAGLLGSLLLAGPAARAADVPPLNEPATGEFRPGKLVWIDLVTADLPGAERFYGELLGWTFARLGPASGQYSLAYHRGEPVAGLAGRDPVEGQARQARWIAYVSVADVPGTVRLVADRGGRVLIPARQVPRRGEMAVVADPDGTPFGLIRSASGDPPDFRAEPGEWIWAIYQSPDASRAAAFYQDVANYEVAVDDRFADRQAFVLIADGFARFNVVESAADRPQGRPDWLYFLRVPDLRAAVARAQALGAGVLLAPDAPVARGILAVISDPSGAPVGLMEWNHDDE